MSSKEREKAVMAQVRAAVDEMGMDGVIYRLAKVAVEKRDEADKAVPKNPAECRYWQQLVVMLNDFSNKVDNVEG